VVKIFSLFIDFVIGTMTVILVIGVLKRLIEIIKKPVPKREPLTAQEIQELEETELLEEKLRDLYKISQAILEGEVSAELTIEGMTYIVCEPSDWKIIVENIKKEGRYFVKEN